LCENIKSVRTLSETNTTQGISQTGKLLHSSTNHL